MENSVYLQFANNNNEKENVDCSLTAFHTLLLDIAEGNIKTDPKIRRGAIDITLQWICLLFIDDDDEDISQDAKALITLREVLSEYSQLDYDLETLSATLKSLIDVNTEYDEEVFSDTLTVRIINVIENAAKWVQECNRELGKN